MGDDEQVDVKIEHGATMDAILQEAALSDAAIPAVLVAVHNGHRPCDVIEAYARYDTLAIVIDERTDQISYVAPGSHLRVGLSWSRSFLRYGPYGD